MTGPFTVDQDVTGDEVTVPITMHAAVDRIVDLLVNHDGIRYHVALLQDLPASSLHHQLAAKSLRENAALRAAVTELLTVELADRVRDAIDHAAHPRECSVCGRPAVNLDRCGAHLDEHRPLGGVA